MLGAIEFGSTDSASKRLPPSPSRRGAPTFSLDRRRCAAVNSKNCGRRIASTASGYLRKSDYSGGAPHRTRLSSFRMGSPRRQRQSSASLAIQISRRSSRRRSNFVQAGRMRSAVARSTSATGPEVSFSLNQKTGSALTRTGIFNVSFEVSARGSYRDTSCVVTGMASVLPPLRDERGWQR